MAKLAESISSAYEERKKGAESRLRELEDLRHEVRDKLGAFEKQREKMSGELQKDREDVLGRLHMANEDLKISVKNLMKVLGVDRREKSAEQAKMLHEFHNALSDSVEKLLRVFAAERQDMKKARDKSLALMMKSLQDSAQDFRRDVQRIMKEGRQEHQENAKKVREQLDHLMVELRQGSEALRGVQRGDGGKVVSGAAKEKKRKVESAKAPVVAEQEDAGVIEAERLVQTVDEKTSAASEDLEGQVLEYIGNHPEGVRIGEMETPLGTTRMRLGVIAKKLYESNRLRKEENLYFPL